MRASLLALLLLLPGVARAATPEACIGEMVAAWRALGSYRTTQTITERLDGELQPEQRTRLSFRKPWEVQLVWETVHPGRRVYWSEERRDGDVLVYPGGLTGRALGVLSFAPDNPILRRDTRHTMAEAGFGFLVEKIASIFRDGAGLDALKMEREGTPVGGEPAWVVSIGKVDAFGYGRAELSISQRTRLPVAFSGWDEAGALLERFGWTGTQVDVAIDPKVDFDLAYP